MISRKSILTYFGVFTLLVSGCGSSSDTDSEKTGSQRELNMTAELDPPANMTPIDKLSLSSKLSEQAEFYQVQTPANSLQASDDGTVCDLVKNTHYSAGMGFIEVGMAGNFQECLSAQSKAVIESLQVNIFQRIECPDDDLSRFNGKSLNEVSGGGSILELCPQSKTLQILNWGKSEQVISFLAKVKTNSNSGTASSAGKACKITVDDGKHHYQDCTRFSKVTQEALSKPSSTTSTNQGITFTPNNIIVSIQLDGVIGDSASRFYDSGDANFRLNNWRGTMSYTGARYAPHWTATNGVDNAAGIFYPKTSTTTPPIEKTKVFGILP